MIIHIGGTYGLGTCLPFVLRNGCVAGFLPPKEVSWKTAQERIAEVDASKSDMHADFLWHMDDGVDASWMNDVFDYPRSQVGKSAMARAKFLAQTAAKYPSPYVCGPAGRPDDPDASRLLSREAADVRDSGFKKRDVLASFVFTRNGLRSGATTSRMHPIDRRVDWVSIAVEDSSDYPSIWNANDWRAWLTLVGRLAQAGYKVLVPYSDVRGVLALAVGAKDFGTAASSKWRQLRPYATAGRGGGAGGPSPSTSYVSAPLMAIVNGDNASLLGNEGRKVESHGGAVSGVQLNLRRRTARFDPSWLATGRPLGEITKARLEQHLSALHALEGAIRGMSTAEVQGWLNSAAQLAESIPGEIFRRPGTKREITARATAFAATVADLGL